MDAFAKYIPTRLIFGVGERRRLAEETAKLGKRVLVVSGRTSARGSGLYDEMRSALLAKGLQVFEFSGIEPNPRLGPCLEGAAICRKQGVEAVVAIGGGSVMDAAKAIAAAARFEGDIWDVFLCRRNIERALPILALPTLAATGSEFNPHSVILNENTRQKFSMHGECIIPSVAILDPEITLTVPREATVYGAIDIIAHALEGYVSAEHRSPLSDRLTEGICTTVMEALEKVLSNPSDVEARSDLLWCSTIACSGYSGAGYGQTYYDGHQIGHELGATWDLPHGATLSMLLPAVMGRWLQLHPARLAQFARRVMGVDPSWDDREEAVGRRGIDRFAAWCRETGAPISLKERAIPRDALPGVAKRVLKNPEAANLDENDVLAVLEGAYER